MSIEHLQCHWGWLNFLNGFLGSIISGQCPASSRDHRLYCIARSSSPLIHDGRIPVLSMKPTVLYYYQLATKVRSVLRSARFFPRTARTIATARRLLWREPPSFLLLWRNRSGRSTIYGRNLLHSVSAISGNLSVGPFTTRGSIVANSCQLSGLWYILTSLSFMLLVFTERPWTWLQFCWLLSKDEPRVILD